MIVAQFMKQFRHQRSGGVDFVLRQRPMAFGPPRALMSSRTEATILLNSGISDAEVSDAFGRIFVCCVAGAYL